MNARLHPHYSIRTTPTQQKRSCGLKQRQRASPAAVATFLFHQHCSQSSAVKWASGGWWRNLASAEHKAGGMNKSLLKAHIAPKRENPAENHRKYCSYLIGPSSKASAAMPPVPPRPRTLEGLSHSRVSRVNGSLVSLRVKQGCGKGMWAKAMGKGCGKEAMGGGWVSGWWNDPTWVVASGCVVAAWWPARQSTNTFRHRKGLR